MAQIFHPIKFPNCVSATTIVSATATAITGITTSATPTFKIPYGCSKARVLLWGAGGGGAVRTPAASVTGNIGGPRMIYIIFSR